jgi:hypothetical protein
MAAQVSLAITIDIQFPNGHATDDWTLPDAGANSFTAPVDIAWKTDVNRYNSGYHIVVLERVGVGNIYLRSNLPTPHPQQFS